ncbi:hypothetical protein IJ384_05330 [bacterium]|nr:hypothetical protein [bacterium]
MKVLPICRNNILKKIAERHSKNIACVKLNEITNADIKDTLIKAADTIGRAARNVSREVEFTMDKSKQTNNVIMNIYDRTFHFFKGGSTTWSKELASTHTIPDNLDSKSLVEHIKTLVKANAQKAEEVDSFRMHRPL